MINKKIIHLKNEDSNLKYKEFKTKHNLNEEVVLIENNKKAYSLYKPKDEEKILNELKNELPCLIFENADNKKSINKNIDLNNFNLDDLSNINRIEFKKLIHNNFNVYLQHFCIVNNEIYILGSLKNKNSKDWDYLIIKMNNKGNIIFYKRIYSKKAEFPRKILYYNNNLYLVGYSASYSYKLFDMNIMKLDMNAELIWQKKIGGLQNDYATDIKIYKDFIYLVGYHK